MTDLLEEAERRGYIVVGTSQDRHSGNSIHRVGLKLMMGEVRRGNAHIVMVWNKRRSPSTAWQMKGSTLRLYRVFGTISR